ncbi:biotin-dependent carboxyltransferase family protein [Streptomyces sp. NPDC058171]
MTDRAVVVVRPGALTTVQDRGRPGYAHLGVPRSGALDPPAAALANRLVGNPEECAVLETTVTGCTVRPRHGVLAAVTGAPCRVTVDGRPGGWGSARWVPAGAVLDLGPATAGVRSYLALGGGVAVDPVLGSRSTDLLSGLGRPPLGAGDVLALGPGRPPVGRVDTAPQPGPPGAHRDLVLGVRFGPRADWFTAAALHVLTTCAYRVSPASNRVGLRTEGPALQRAVAGELPSEGLVLGAVQVPPDGRPVVFLADHPTTGGYPVVAVVREADLPAVAQAAPGTPVRFVVAPTARRRGHG